MKSMNVKTTEIKKKFKDKKTGEWKELTINHAKVKDRLKAFWEANPYGKIETSSKKDTEGITTFKTFILASKKEEFSREATGHAQGVCENDKDFEKLETISVGRALALLGYATDGEVASLEEMEDFLNDKDRKKIELLERVEEEVSVIETRDELVKYYNEHSGLGKEVVAIITSRGNELKAKK